MRCSGVDLRSLLQHIARDQRTVLFRSYCLCLMTSWSLKIPSTLGRLSRGYAVGVGNQRFTRDIDQEVVPLITHDSAEQIVPLKCVPVGIAASRRRTCRVDQKTDGSQLDPGVPCGALGEGPRTNRQVTDEELARVGDDGGTVLC